MKHIDTSRERTKRRIPRRFMGVLLAAAVTASVMPVGGFAVSDSSERTAELCAHHSVHTAECGFSEEDNAPCGYVCGICPIEDLIAALPDKVTEDNEEEVRAQLDEILALYRELDEDEQEEINLYRCYALQEALDNANASMMVAEEIDISENLNNILTEEDGGCQGHTFTGTTANATRIYVESGTHNVTFSNLKITTAAAVGVAPGATMNLTIEGTNTIKAGSYAGIYVPKGAKLVITAESTGTLDVSSPNAAGIGGAYQDPNNEGGDLDCGTVVINGGTVTATGGSSCAGIGGGTTNDAPGNGGNVTINGGTVTATGGSDGYYDGAGIGGGSGNDGLSSGSGGTLTINGGNVTLKAGQYDPQWSTAHDFGRGSGDASGGTCELTLAGESYLTANSLDPNGKYTINGDPTEDMIVVPEELIYNGKAQELDGKIYIDDTKTGTGTYFNQTFTVKASADGWVLQDLGEVVGAGEYTATFKKGNKEISKTFTVAKSDTDLKTEGKVLTYNGDTQTTTFNADDTITVKAAPTATGAAPQKAAARLRSDYTAPTAGQMALFVGDVQVSEPVNAGEDGIYTMTVSAADVLLKGNTEPNGNAITLTAKFVGNTSMADGTGTATVSITAAAKAEKDGAVIGYYGESNLADAFADANSGATVTLLDNITTSTRIDVETENLTLDLNGKTYTYTTGNTAFQISFGSLTIKGSGAITASSFYCLAVDEGTLNIESGSFSAADYAVYVSSGTLALTGGSFTGGKNAIKYASGDVKDALKNYGGTDAPHYAFYEGGQPHQPTGSSLPGGTFTVKECQHTGVEVTNLGDGKHGLTCPYCGYHYEHTTTLTATASGNNVTLNGGCGTEGCGYQTTLGTASFTFPKVTYGQSGDVTCTWDGPMGYYVLIEVVVGSENQFDKNEDENIAERSWTLAQLFGSTKVTAGKHKLKVSFFSDVRSNECELDFTIDPAPLTPSITGTATKPYDGTTGVASDQLSITLTGVVNGDTVTAAATSYAYDSVNAGENKTITASGITLGGADAGNYTLTKNSATIKGTIAKAQGTLTVPASSIEKTFGDEEFALNCTTNGDGKIFYSSDNENVATVSTDGTVLIKGAGEAEITVSLAEGTNHTGGAEKKITLKVEKAENVPNKPSAEMNIANRIDKVSGVELPEGWQWQDVDKDTALEVGAPTKATAEYVGTDKDNYKNLTVEVTITRSNCDHAHKELRNVVTATCQRKGYTGDTYCLDCKELMSNGNEIPMADHSGGTATCISGKICEVCGTEYTAKDSGNHMHTEIRGAIDATCTAKGYTGDTYCTVCGELLTLGSETPIVNHISDDGTVTKQPTTSETGEKTYKCTVCGNVIRTETIDKLPSGGGSGGSTRPDRPSTPGTISDDIRLGENTPKINIKMTLDELIKAVCTSAEQQLIEDGTDGKIILSVKNVDEELLKSFLGGSGYTVVLVLDIDLLKEFGGSEISVTETNGEITIEIEIPEALRSTGREYVIIRYHNGERSVLEDTDSSDSTITFKTDRFSMYALAYRTETVDPDTSDTSSDNSGSSDQTDSGNPSTGESDTPSDNSSAASNDSGSSSGNSSSDNSGDISDSGYSGNKNPSTGIAVSLVPLTAALAALVITVKRRRK